MDFVSSDISAYAERYTQKPSALLEKIKAYTQSHVPMPRMLSSRLQGRILALLSCLVQPKTVLDIGTYTGYSALCLAEGLQHNGVVHTLDNNQDLASVVRKFLSESAYKNNINYMLGEAKDSIKQIKGTFDMVFIDADKKNYALYYDLVIDRVRKGGLIIADNVLWSGKVLDAPSKQDRITRCLAAFNAKIIKDKRCVGVLLPLRDGLMVLRRV